MILAVLVSLASIAPVSRPAAPQPTVVVVRHAEKASQTERDPALSAWGEVRAAALDSVLEHAKVVAVIVSPYRRTVETAALVARRHLLTPIVVPIDGSVAAHAYAIAQRARQFDGVVLVVGHSNTVLPIVRALGGPTLPDLCDSAYGQFFTVVTAPIGAASLVRSQYGVVDPPGPTFCPSMTAP